MAEARVYYAQNNFTAGELSPRMSARIDFEKYNNGLIVGENCFVYPQGGATRRSGKRFVNPVKDQTKATGLVPFVFSDEQAYMIEFGAGYVRFYKDGGRIESPPGTPVEVATPYIEADLFDVHYLQSFDTLYLFHQDYKTRKITRTSHTSWAVSVVNWVGGPFRDQIPSTGITIAPSVTTGSGTLTASAAIFTADHVGAFWEFTYGATVGYVQITAFNSSTSVNMTVKTTLGGTSSTASWREGMWSDERGYPATGAIYEQRLVAGGSPDNPQAFAGSVSGDYENMTEGTANDDAFVFTIGAQTSSVIRWFSPLQALLIGTNSSVFKASGGSGDAGITPSNIFVRTQSAIGASRAMPVLIDKYVLYVQKSKRKVFQTQYDFGTDSYESDDALILSEHLGSTGIKRLTYAGDPDYLMWAVRNDGTMLSMTHLPRQKVMAWFRHPEGTPDTDFVEDTATIPHPDGDRDQTWVIVQRYVDGGVKRYIEYYDEDLMVDSGLSYSGAPVSSIAGLGHLIGRTVQIVGDGAPYPPKVVDNNGEVVLDGLPASEVSVGLGYDSILIPARPEVQTADGTSLGRPRRIGPVRIQFYQTLGAQFGDETYETIDFRKGSDPMDAPPPQFTGTKQIANLGWGPDVTYTVKQTQPLPFTVLGCFPAVEVGD